MSFAKLQLTHIVSGNAPLLGWILADLPVLAQRTFSGIGAPSATTLAAGNGRYCGLTSGFVVNAAVVNAGSGYKVGDVLFAVLGAAYTVGTTTITPAATAVAQITIDAVSGSGQILDWHVTTVGNYSVYSQNPVATTNSTGIGGGATFNLALQPADNYLDVTTPTAPVLYVCQTAGTNNVGSAGGSVWAQVSGSVRQLKVFADGGDFMLCSPWDGTNIMIQTVYVAKPYKLRTSLASETIQGALHTYTYTPTYISGTSGNVAYYTRTNSWLVNGQTVTETETVTPDYVLDPNVIGANPGDIIYAMPFKTNAPASLVGVNWIDINVDGRAWAAS